MYIENEISFLFPFFLRILDEREGNYIQSWITETGLALTFTSLSEQLKTESFGDDALDKHKYNTEAALKLKTNFTDNFHFLSHASFVLNIAITSINTAYTGLNITKKRNLKTHTRRWRWPMTPNGQRSSLSKHFLSTPSFKSYQDVAPPAPSYRT